MRHPISVLCVSAILLAAPVPAQEQGNLATALMNSTFKLEGGGASGTVFILGEPLPTEPERAAFVLVTAAHVLEQVRGDTVAIHLRSKAGDVFSRLRVPLAIRLDGKPLWVRHPEADVAAMRVRLPKAAYVELVTTTFLADEEKVGQLAIGPGDELLVLGFPYGAESSDAGFPILRSGRVASYPLLPTSLTKSFLLDFEVFKGNSGGPVFLMSGLRAQGSGVQLGRFFFVLGVVSQERGVQETVKSLDEVLLKTHQLGLAVVVHAQFIKDAIKLLPPLEPGV